MHRQQCYSLCSLQFCIPILTSGQLHTSVQNCRLTVYNCQCINCRKQSKRLSGGTGPLQKTTQLARTMANVCDDLVQANADSERGPVVQPAVIRRQYNLLLPQKGANNVCVCVPVLVCCRDLLTNKRYKSNKKFGRSRTVCQYLHTVRQAVFVCFCVSIVRPTKLNPRFVRCSLLQRRGWIVNN